MWIFKKMDSPLFIVEQADVFIGIPGFIHPPYVLAKIPKKWF
jgi:hypothetical protein